MVRTKDSVRVYTSQKDARTILSAELGDIERQMAASKSGRKKLQEQKDLEMSGHTIPELKEIAKSRGISLKGKTKKADILEALSEHLDESDESDQSDENPASKDQEELLTAVNKLVEMRVDLLRIFKTRYGKEIKKLRDPTDNELVLAYLAGEKIPICDKNCIKHLQLPRGVITEELKNSMLKMMDPYSFC